MKIQAGALALFLAMHQTKGFVIPWEKATTVNALASSYMDKLSPGTATKSTYSPFSNNKVSGASGTVPSSYTPGSTNTPAVPGSPYTPMRSASPFEETPPLPPPTKPSTPSTPTPITKDPAATASTTASTTASATASTTTASSTIFGPAKSAKQEAISSKLTVLETELEKTKQELGGEVERLTRQLAELLVEQTQVQQEQEMVFALEQAQADEERRQQQALEEQELRAKLKLWEEELQAQHARLKERAQAEAAQLEKTRAEAAELERARAEKVDKLAAINAEAIHDPEGYAPPPPPEGCGPPLQGYAPPSYHQPSPHQGVTYSQPPPSEYDFGYDKGGYQDPSFPQGGRMFAQRSDNTMRAPPTPNTAWSQTSRSEINRGNHLRSPISNAEVAPAHGGNGNFDFSQHQTREIYAVPPGISPKRVNTAWQNTSFEQIKNGPASLGQEPPSQGGWRGPNADAAGAREASGDGPMSMDYSARQVKNWSGFTPNPFARDGTPMTAGGHPLPVRADNGLMAEPNAPRVRQMGPQATSFDGPPAAKRWPNAQEPSNNGQAVAHHQKQQAPPAASAGDPSPIVPDGGTFAGTGGTDLFPKRGNGWNNSKP